MMKIWLVLLALLVGVYARAETIQCYDALALPKYCSTYLKAPKLPAVSVLISETTFGNPLGCLTKRAAQGGLDLVKFHLIDATCHRNRVCPSGAAKPDDLQVIWSRAAEVSVWCDKNDPTLCLVSPSLEHDVKDCSRVKKMMAAAQSGCPSCIIINSPFSGCKVEPLELHGTKVRAFSVSGDGASMFDADTRSTDGNGFNHTEAGEYLTCGWWNELNLRCTGEERFVKPGQRSARPTLDQFRQAYQLFQPEELKPAAPPQCKSVRSVSGNEISKTNSEAYCNNQRPDSRGNKGLLILRKGGKRGDKLKVLNSKGKEAGCFSYYGPFTEKGLHRWYIGTCSNQTPYKLFKALGSEWGFAQLGRGQCLLFNSIRRMGRYR